MIKVREFISSFINLTLKKKPIPGYYIFTFHQILDKGEPLFNKGTNTRVKDFLKIINYINSDFKIITMRDFLKIKEKTISEPYAILTFDDGDKSCECFVHPLLVDLGIPATFFINTYTHITEKLSWPFLLRYIKKMEKENHKAIRNDSDILNLRFTSNPEIYFRAISKIYSYQKRLPNYKDLFVSELFLQNLDNHQFTIGNHGHEHHRYSLLNFEQQLKDYSLSKNYLESFKAFENIFAIPFGRTSDYNLDTLNIVTNDNSLLFTSMGGVNIVGQNINCRIPADNLSYEILSFKYF